jgi:hypothetical protein
MMRTLIVSCAFFVFFNGYSMEGWAFSDEIADEMVDSLSSLRSKFEFHGENYSAGDPDEFNNANYGLDFT